MLGEPSSDHPLHSYTRARARRNYPATSPMTSRLREDEDHRRPVRARLVVRLSFHGAGNLGESLAMATCVTDGRGNRATVTRTKYGVAGVRPTIPKLPCLVGAMSMRLPDRSLAALQEAVRPARECVEVTEPASLRNLFLRCWRATPGGTTPGARAGGSTSSPACATSPPAGPTGAAPPAASAR